MPVPDSPTKTRDMGHDLSLPPEKPHFGLTCSLQGEQADTHIADQLAA